jgi:hypothetical protein
VPAERDHELRPRRLDHLAIVGEGRAAEPLCALLGDVQVAVRNPDDVAFEIAQYPQIGGVIG